MGNSDLDSKIDAVIQHLRGLSQEDLVQGLNQARERLHSISPFSAEPCDFVRWVPATAVRANDYNPNVVAPPEMELLRLSIEADGYTQPIVAWPLDDGSFEVVDGFHRHRVGSECEAVRNRISGYLPLAVVNPESTDRGDRIASTIRHNRARGKHLVDRMSDIVQELTRRNWTPEKIGRDLGMEPDEVLRLRQITGLAEMFADREFSEAWEVE